MDDLPAAFLLELPRLVLGVERPDRLRRLLEGRVVLGYEHVRQQAGDGPSGDRLELALDQRADLRLRLRDGEVERQRRRLVGGALVAQELVADLGPVPVRDHELGLVEERPQGGADLAQVRALLGRGTALAGPHERVPAEGDDCGHSDVACDGAFRASRLCWLARLRC